MPMPQGGPASSLSEGGLSIGLTVAEELAERHGGSIEAFSQGQGEA
jgi:signal transduction histidine kinase